MCADTSERALTNAHARARTHTHTQKHVRLTAFPWQQWFHERTSMLHYTYIASLVYATTSFKNSELFVFSSQCLLIQ